MFNPPKIKSFPHRVLNVGHRNLNIGGQTVLNYGVKGLRTDKVAEYCMEVC